jgi:hypothetical protein
LDEAHISRGRVWELVHVRETVFESGTRLKEDKRLFSVCTSDHVKDGNPVRDHENIALQPRDCDGTYTGTENLLIHRGSMGADFSAVLKAKMSPFGKDWTYASSAERRYIVCIVLSRLFGP